MSGFALGFGSVEAAFEEQQEAALRDFVAEQEDRGYFTDSLIADLSAWIEQRSRGAHEAAKAHHAAADHPDRYSEFWATVLADASNIVVAFRFHHINRKHPLSPDGWAAMPSKRLVHIEHPSIAG